jgi:hypothetical protein
MAGPSSKLKFVTQTYFGSYIPITHPSYASEFQVILFQNYPGVHSEISFRGLFRTPLMSQAMPSNEMDRTGKVAVVA